MTESWTKTTESGAFIRTTTRKGGRRHQETKRFTPNDEKVVLGHIGDFEVYVYPYNFPDKVFIGHFPVSTVLDANCVSAVLSAYNKARWYLNGEWQNKPQHRIAPNSRRRSIVRAYNLGLIHQTKPNASRSNTNYNYSTNAKGVKHV